MPLTRMILPTLIVAALATASIAGAQTTQYGTTSGDPRFREDGRACWDAVAEGQDTACVVLYAHILDLLNPASLNTQRPPDDLEDRAHGFTAHPGVEPHWDLNQIQLRPTPGMIDYRRDGEFLTHAAYGLALDATLDPDVPIHAYWYMSADATARPLIGPDPLSDDPSLGTLPCLTVRMTIETGRSPNEGTLLTQAEVTKTVVTGADTGQPDAEHACPGDRTAKADVGEVVEFHVEMPPIRTPLTASEGWVMTVEWWNFAPDDPDQQDKTYLHAWNVHTGPRFAPRVVLPLQDAVHAEAPTVAFAEDQMVLQNTFQSTLGSYDIDPGSIRLQVFDDHARPVRTSHIGEPVVTYGTEHDGFWQPLRAAVPWAYEKEDLPPGAYTLRMSASNWQWSSATANETTVVLHGEAAESPAPAPLLSFLPFLLLWALATPRRPRADHRNP